MLRKILLFCGIVAPVIYVFTAIVGAAVRPDYSHIVNAISELISNGAPNKAILDIVFNIYNVLLLAFAIGGYIVLKNASRLCRIAMGIFIAIQILSFSWGFFPMDPIRAAERFRYEQIADMVGGPQNMTNRGNLLSLEKAIQFFNEGWTQTISRWPDWLTKP